MRRIRPVDSGPTESESVREALDRIAAESTPSEFVAGLDAFIVRLDIAGSSHPIAGELRLLLGRDAAAYGAVRALHEINNMLGAAHLVNGLAAEAMDRASYWVTDSEGAEDFRKAKQSHDEVGWFIRAAGDLAKAARKIDSPAVPNPETRLREPISLVARLLNEGDVLKPVHVGQVPDLLVRASVGPLLQVLINLGRNARRFISEPAGRIDIECWCSLEEAFVRVRDNGPGVPELVAPRLWDLNFSTKEAGGGVGLYECRRLVRQWGGLLSLEDTDEPGASFVFSIPLT